MATVTKSVVKKEVVRVEDVPTYQLNLSRVEALTVLCLLAQVDSNGVGKLAHKIYYELEKSLGVKFDIDEYFADYVPMIQFNGDTTEIFEKM